MKSSPQKSSKKGWSLKRGTAFFCALLIAGLGLIVWRNAEAWFYLKTKTGESEIVLEGDNLNIKLDVNDVLDVPNNFIIEKLTLRAPTYFSENKLSGPAGGDTDDENFDMAAKHITLKMTNTGTADIRPSIKLTATDSADAATGHIKFAVVLLDDIDIPTASDTFYYPTYMAAIEKNWKRVGDADEEPVDPEDPENPVDPEDPENPVDPIDPDALADDTLEEYNRRVMRETEAISTNDFIELGVIVWLDKSVIKAPAPSGDPDGGKVSPNDPGSPLILGYKIKLSVTAVDKNAYI